MKKMIFLIIVIILSLIFLLYRNETSEENNLQDSTNLEYEIRTNIEQTKELISKDNDLIILDVRTKEEYDQGHIDGAILIPYDEIETHVKDIEKSKDKPLLVYCRSGRRSSIAIKTLKNKGFKKIYHMYEGYMNWK